MPNTMDVEIVRTWPDRDADAVARNRLSVERDTVARERDDLARLRDLGSRRRDRAAAERDHLALQRDLSAVRRNDPAACVVDRLAASRDRASASLDRIRCADDRREAAMDRQMSALDRWQASLDRMRDAQDRRHARAEHTRLSHDELTGLLRRGTGMTRLDQELTRVRRNGGTLSVAFVDVDDLKVVNDTAGHGAGDQLLRDVAKALRDCMRSYDVVLRLGGDEFVCGMVDVPAEVAAQRFDAVARMLGERNASVSVGIAEVRDEESAEHVVRRADTALVESRIRAGGHVRGRRAARVQPAVIEVAGDSGLG
jgi:diguanylate cyclase (GGDEF)-like protein